MARSSNNRFKRTIFAREHEAVRESFRGFLAKEIVPHYAQWEQDGIIPHEIFESVGAHGYMGLPIPADYGGQGLNDFRFSVVMNEECSALGLTSFITGIALINDVALPYFMKYAVEEQKRRWFPGMVSGKLVVAIAMTEPGGGSDLTSITTTARREGDHYVVNGSKTFISNGINADLVLTAVKTDPGARHGGISLLAIERGTPGFHRGRALKKLGTHAQDTAELFFSEARVPASNLVGAENGGFRQMMNNLPQERLGVAISAVASARKEHDWTLAYVKQRKAFGKAIGTFQHARMALAEMRTEVEIAQIFVDKCLALHVGRELTAEQAAMAKYWSTEMQARVLDRCVQLHGGSGCITDTPIARAYLDARVMRIYGGANEIMKEIIGAAEGLAG